MSLERLISISLDFNERLHYHWLVSFNLHVTKGLRIEDMEFPAGVLNCEVRKFGNYMGQLKKKQNFQGCSRKNSCAIYVEFP